MDEGKLPYGTQIQPPGSNQSKAGNARTEAWPIEKRQVGKKGNEPQASHRHRPVTGAEGRCARPSQKVPLALAIAVMSSIDHCTEWAIVEGRE
jgi:hypothetical protein